MKTMLESSNPTAAFHSICSWKLLRFSLSLLVSCHSRSPARSPSRGCIFLPGLPSLMSESFHLTKSLLGRVSPVSLHLCQGPFHTSEHFNDIWCWDGGGGSGGRETETQHHPQPGRTHGKVLEDNWVVKEAPEEDDLGASWSISVQFFSHLSHSWLPRGKGTS